MISEIDGSLTIDCVSLTSPGSATLVLDYYEYLDWTCIST